MHLFYEQNIFFFVNAITTIIFVKNALLQICILQKKNQSPKFRNCALQVKTKKNVKCTASMYKIYVSL